jgi:putative transposase
LCFEDESGFSLVSPLKRTWAPRGQTPVVRTSIFHHSRLNVIGTLLISPAGKRIHLSTRLHHRSLTGQQIISFLESLLCQVHGPIVLVWDNHPIHKRKLVQLFIAEHPRLHLFPFPAYAPELNPAEGIWLHSSQIVQQQEILIISVPLL